MVGALAVLAALGARHRAPDSKDALRALLAEPLGHVRLGAIAAGLLCFALWRLAQAVLDADHCGDDLKALERRGVFAVTAVFYLGFAATAANMALGGDSGASNDQAARAPTARRCCCLPPPGCLLSAATNSRKPSTGASAHQRCARPRAETGIKA